jgi:hypothetical protein
MITPMSIVSLDQGKLWREKRHVDRPAEDAPRAAVPVVGAGAWLRSLGRLFGLLGTHGSIGRA